jgi:hypothetical protein
MQRCGGQQWASVRNDLACMFACDPLLMGLDAKVMGSDDANIIIPDVGDGQEEQKQDEEDDVSNGITSRLEEEERKEKQEQKMNEISSLLR